jgi:uncharacterized protein (TIGR02246 family)
MSRLEEAADLVELRALVERYGVAADSRDRERFGGVFTPDGVLSISGLELKGRDVIPSILDYLDAHYPKSMHFMGNHDVVLDGDTARGVVYCRAHHLRIQGDSATNSVMVIRYEDQFVRSGEGWLIEHRLLSFDWEEERPVFAEPRPPLD